MTATQPRITLRPQTGKPETIALQYASGKTVPSRIPGAPNQVYYSLVDGRAMYLPLEVAHLIDKLELKPGERFVLHKRGPGDWQVNRETANHPTTIADIFSTATNPNLKEIAASAKVNSQGEDAAAILARHYSKAIEIALQAVETAKAKGLMVAPSFEDIRCIASVMMISEQRR